MPHGDTLPVLADFVSATATSTGLSEEESRAQVFTPTGFPDKIQVAPGVVFSKPDRFDYAPDIEVADRKIRSLNAAARSGNLAILNISIEPGSGKTLFLPFKFTESECLVVLPTVFDAWSAHTANTALSNIRVYGVDTQHNSRVTYTDSYYAAYLLTSGLIQKYGVVFVDESHSQEGVTSFMSSVARPGQVYVRMTASPPTANSRVKKAFPVVEERDVPDFSSLQHAAGYVASRKEHRVLVLTPSPQSAAQLSSLVPHSQLMTKQSPLESLSNLMSDQTGSVLAIADFVCGKGININADCVVDFGSVDTPGGSRKITMPEQLQRKYRVGRSKPGVYCCSFTATASRVTDNYSIFRSNLWLLMNGLPSVPCTFVDPLPHNLSKLLASTMEPALLPLPDTPAPSPVPVTPVVPPDDTASDSGDTVSTESRPGSPIIDYNTLVLDDEPEPKAPEDRDFASPSWYAYYVEHHNHPNTYVADLVYEHRGISAAAVHVDSDLVVQKASNRRVRVIAPGEEQPANRRSLTRIVNEAAQSKIDLHSWNSMKTRPKRVGLGMTMSSQSSAGVKYGSVGYDVSNYRSSTDSEAARGLGAFETGHSEADARRFDRHNNHAKLGPNSPNTSLGRTKSVHDSRDIPFDGVHLGGPLAIIRGTKVSRQSRGVSYKAASVCGGYLTITGVVLASGRDMHSALVPLHQDARAALHDTTTASRAINATHYLTWVETKPLDSIDVQLEISNLKSIGAWSIPPINTLPTIDLEVEYDPIWVNILTDRIRNKSALPPVIPRGGFYEVSRKNRIRSDDVIDVALAACEYPSYSTAEQQNVYRAWNVLAIKSASVSTVSNDIFSDAQVLLTYMSGADRLNDL